RTEAEDLWARMSHRLLYKPATELPKNVVRPLYHLLSLVELFDSEVERAVVRLSEHPDHQLNTILRQAEQSFYTFCATTYSQELSIEVGRVLVRALDGAEVDSYRTELAAFADNHRPQLESIYRDYGPERPR